jgi:hypothetical protein
MNVTRLAGLTTTIIGRVGSSPSDEEDYSIVRGESETWQKMPNAVICQNNFEVNRVRVMVGEDHLLGAVVMGDQAMSMPLEELVANQVDITPIRDQLVQPGAKLNTILMNYWNDWRRQDAI